MPSEQRIVANRLNAKKSTGPRSEEGRRKARRNALRHGLAIDVAFDPYFHRTIEAAAKTIVFASASGITITVARHLAETEIDLLRIRDVRTALFKVHYEKRHLRPDDYADLTRKLTKLKRYEHRAFSRRKRALRLLAG